MNIVATKEEHIPFIAWVQLTAARSHLPRSIFDIYIESTDEETLRFIETLATTKVWHYGSVQNFLIAEVDGTPAAGLSGYFVAECGLPKFLEGVAEANVTLGRTAEQNAAGMARIAAFSRCNPTREPGAWIVEWVATHPDFRRRGLIDRLLAEILDAGRKKGATTAEIGVLIGNDPAQRAYEKNGFAVVDECRDAEFEATFGTPGVRLLRRTI